jgi:hypothetical protein
VVEAVKEETKGRQEEVRAAAKNTGSGLQEWIIEEAAWIVAQFAKVGLSLAVVRGVQQLFKIGFASESAYQRAPDLWSHGYQDRGHQSASAGYSQPGTSSGSWRWRGPEDRGGSAQGGGSFDQGTNQNAPESPRYVTSVAGYHLYLHRKILNPGKQFWPCPLLYVSACESCSFFEYDHGGRPQCAALVKLRMVLDGNDGGEDLDEISDWIRRS